MYSWTDKNNSPMNYSNVNDFPKKWFNVVVYNMYKNTMANFEFCIFTQIGCLNIVSGVKEELNWIPAEHNQILLTKMLGHRR